MPGIEVGSAYARFLLELAEFRENVAEARATIAQLREEVKLPIVAKFRIEVDKSQLTAVARVVQREQQAELSKTAIIQTVEVKLNKAQIAAVKQQLQQELDLGQVSVGAVAGRSTAVNAVQQPNVDRSQSTAATSMLQTARQRLENAQRAAEEVTRLETALTAQRARLTDVEARFLAAEADAKRAAAQAAAKAAADARQSAAAANRPQFTEVDARKAVLQDAEERLANVGKGGAEIQTAFDIAARKVKNLTETFDNAVRGSEEEAQAKKLLAKAERELAQKTDALQRYLTHLGAMQAERNLAQERHNAALARQAAQLDIGDISKELAAAEQSELAAVRRATEARYALENATRDRIAAENAKLAIDNQRRRLTADLGDNPTSAQEVELRKLGSESRTAAQKLGRLHNLEVTAANDDINATHNLAVARDKLRTVLEAEIAVARQRLVVEQAAASKAATIPAPGTVKQASFADAPDQNTPQAQALRLKNEMDALAAELAQTESALELLRPAAVAATDATLEVAAAEEQLAAALRREAAGLAAPDPATKVQSAVVSTVTPPTPTVRPVDEAQRQQVIAELATARSEARDAEKAAQTYQQLTAQVAVLRAKYEEAERRKVLAEVNAVRMGGGSGGPIRPAPLTDNPASVIATKSAVSNAAFSDPSVRALEVETKQLQAERDAAAQEVKNARTTIKRLAAQQKYTGQWEKVLADREAALASAVSKYAVATDQYTQAFDATEQAMREAAVELRQRGIEATEDRLTEFHSRRRAFLDKDEEFGQTQFSHLLATSGQEIARSQVGKARTALDLATARGDDAAALAAQQELAKAEAYLAEVTERFARTRTRMDAEFKRANQEFLQADRAQWEASLPQAPSGVHQGFAARAKEMEAEMAKAAAEIAQLTPQIDDLGDATGRLRAAKDALANKERAVAKASAASDQFLPVTVPVETIDQQPTIQRYREEVQEHLATIEESAKRHHEYAERAKAALAKGNDDTDAEARAADELARMENAQRKLARAYEGLNRELYRQAQLIEDRADFLRSFAAENPDIKDPEVELRRRQRDYQQQQVEEAERDLAEKRAAFDAMKAQSSAGGRDRRAEGDIDGGTAQNEWENAEWRVTDAKRQLAEADEDLVAAMQRFEAAKEAEEQALNKAAQAAQVNAQAVAAQAAAPTPPRRIARTYDRPSGQAVVPAQVAAPAPPSEASLPASLAAAESATGLAKTAQAIDAVNAATMTLIGLGPDEAKVTVAKLNAAKQYSDAAVVLRDQLTRVADDIPRQVQLIKQLAAAEDAAAQQAKQLGAEQIRAANAEDQLVANKARLLAQQGKYAQSMDVLDAHIAKLRKNTELLTDAEDRRISMERLAIRIDREGAAVANELADAVTRRHLAARDLQPARAQNLAEQAALPPEGQRNVEEAKRAAQLGVEQAEIERRIADEAYRHGRALIALNRTQREYEEGLRIVREALNANYRVNKALEDQTTAWINLKRLERQIEIEAEREARKIADADIAAAKAAGNRALAQERLNAELERTRRLPTYLGGAGGAGTPPPGGVGVGTIPPDDRTPRIAQLQKEAEVIAAMPTFWSRAAAGALRYVGPLALVTAGYHALSVAGMAARNAITTVASNELATRQLQALFNNMRRGTDTMQSAILFGREFNRTQREMGEAAGEAGIILQTTSVEASKAFEIIERLRTRAPQQNFAAGVRSIAELQSGQLQSIERVFNVPRRFAHEMSEAIKRGEDPLLAVDRVLNKLGQTSEVLRAQTEGPLAQFRALRVAGERLAITVANALIPAAEGLAEALTRDANAAAAIIENFTRPIDISNYVRAYREMAEERRKANLEGKVTIGLGVLTTPFDVAGRAAELQKEQDEAAKGFERVNLSVEQIRENALKAAPALAQFLDVGAVEQEAAAVIDLNNRVNALVNRYTSEQSTAKEFFTQIQNARKEAGDIDVDPSLAVEGIRRVSREYSTVEDRISALTVLAGQLSRAMGDPALGLSDKLGADIEAVAAEILRLNGMLPIDVEIRLKHVEQFTAFTNNVVAAGQQMETALKDNEKTLTAATSQALEDRTQAYIDYVTNVAKINDQLTRQQKRANEELAYQQQLALTNFQAEQVQSIVDRNSEKILAEREFYRGVNQQRSEFERSQAQGRDAFNRQEIRSEQDYQRQLARQSEDRAVAQFRKERDRRREDERDEKQHRDTLLRMQRDYMIDATRSFEDFELERLTLLAQGRIADAMVLQSRFDVERRRKAEDFARDVSDVGDQFGRGTADRKTQRQREDQDAAEDQERADARARQDRERQVRQAREDFELQQRLAEENQRHQQQLAEVNFRHQQELADQQFNEQFRRREAQFVKQQQAERDALKRQQELEKQDRDQAVIDAGTAFEAQLAAIDKRLGDEVNKYKERRTEIVDEFNAAYVEQERLLALHQKEIDRIEQLKADGIEEKEAEAIAHLETARDEYERVLGESKQHFKNFTVVDEITRINKEIDALMRAARGEGTPVSNGVGGGANNSSTFGDWPPPYAGLLNPDGSLPALVNPDRTKDDFAGIVPPSEIVRTQATEVARETAAYISTERTKDDTFIKDTETALGQHHARVLSQAEIQQRALSGIFNDTRTATIVPPASVVRTQTTDVARETAAYISGERTKDDTFIRDTEKALELHHGRVLSQTEIQQRAISGIFTDQQTGITQTVVQEQGKVEVAVRVTNSAIHSDTERQQAAIKRLTVTHTGAVYDLYKDLGDDINVEFVKANARYNTEQQTQAMLREKVLDREFGVMFNSAVSWSFKTLQTIGETINQVLSGVPAAGGAAARAAFGDPQVVSGGVIRNGTMTDDPRVSRAALVAGFGPSATLTSTYDSTRPRGQGVPVPGTNFDAHAGVDVTMTQGSRVKCPITIRVIKVSDDQFENGTTILGIDEFGRQWLFAHLTQVTVKEGQTIRQGEYMGVIGSVGHVHVQLRSQNDTSIPIDPTAALNEAAGVGSGAGPNGASQGGVSGRSTGGGTRFTTQANPAAAGTAWGLTFRDAAAAQMMPVTLDILPNLRDLDHMSALALNGGAMSRSSASAQPTITISLKLGDVTMDGRSVGAMVAPHIAEVFSDELNVSAQVVETVYTPGVYQQAFRRPL